MTRGRLRIYLGASPGVGKTVNMLDEGHRRAERGTDVVVGLVETHGRTFTASLLEGLEQVPRRDVEYHGATLHEMDLDAILARRPAVVLVDELAHTNAPGSRHEKRYEDVLELLDAGIDVISTVNIQHLESLNDAVAAITGIKQKETVPDEIVRAADQIDLVDMSPDALRRRMSHGHIYSADQIDAALANYFRPGNLAALRELALLWMADKVDAGLEDYRAAHSIAGLWPVRERVVVALSGRPGSEALLRRGARIASRLAGGEMLAAYITRGDGLTTAPLGTVTELQRITQELGGEFHTITGDDPTQALLDFARGVNATQILVGTDTTPSWQRMLVPSFAQQVIAGAGDIDVHVVPHATAASGFRRGRTGPLPARRLWVGLVSALVLPGALAGLLWAGRATFTLATDVPLFLLATVVVALVGGMAPALVAAIASTVLLNWLFIAPVGAFAVNNPDNVLALLVFVAVGVLVAAIVHLNERAAARSWAAQRESVALAELSHSLLGSTEQVPLLLQRALDMFGAKGAGLVRPAAFGVPEVVAAVGAFDPAAPYDHEPVDEHHELALQPPGLPAGQRRLFAAFAAHAGAILAREALAQAAEAAGGLARDSAAKTAILSAVSTDLRAPLAGIKDAVGALRTSQVAWSGADEANLSTIESSAVRLERQIGNLLYLSRLQIGGVVARPTRLDLRKAIPGALRGDPNQARMEWAVEPEARWVYADAALLARLLGNIVCEAVRAQPDGTPVQVNASRLADRVEIRVVGTAGGVREGDEADLAEADQPVADDPDGFGSRLALTVARGLAEAMGGQAGAEPTPGGGLTMVVALPTNPGQAVKAED